jgi:hypothetical protein
VASAASRREIPLRLRASSNRSPILCIRGHYVGVLFYTASTE